MSLPEGFDPARAAVLTIDLQNDFLHPDGAYGRAGIAAPALAALPARLRPVIDAARGAGMAHVSAQFTLVPGPGGRPIIAAHLRRLRPFLTTGDFAPGGFGHALVAQFEPADYTVEKVAYSAFFQSRLEFVLRALGVQWLVIGGIVTNGGVASTVRDAHLRDLHTVLLSDGCAAFDAAVHDATLVSLGGLTHQMRCAAFCAEIGG